MTVAFRNVTADPNGPVETWPSEAVQAALERGGLSDWRRIVKAIDAAPWGRTARQVEEVLTHSRPYGVAELMEISIRHAREMARAAERAAVAREINELLEASELTRADFATGIGTSTSRLSTYLSGTVTPSAALMVRMRNLAARAGAHPGRLAQ